MIGASGSTTSTLNLPSGTGFTVTSGPGGNPCIVLRPACDALGISVPSQVRRLTHEPWAHLDVIDTSSADGSRRKMTVLALESVPMWLATIRASRVTVSARKKLFAFQQRAADALRDHIYRGISVADAGAEELDVLESMIGVLRGQVDRVNRIAELATEAAETERLNAARLAALEGAHEPGRLAALAYATLHGMPTDVGSCRRLGVAAGKIGRDLGLDVRTIPHPVYDTQNVWPEHVWDAAAASLGTGGTP